MARVVRRRRRLASRQRRVNKTARHGGFKYEAGGAGRRARHPSVWFPFDVIFAQTLLRIGFEIERRRVTNLAQHLISRTPMSASHSHPPPKLFAKFRFDRKVKLYGNWALNGYTCETAGTERTFRAARRAVRAPPIERWYEYCRRRRTERVNYQKYDSGERSRLTITTTYINNERVTLKVIHLWAAFVFNSA